MSAGGGTGVRSFLPGYVSALTDYLRDPSERSLRVAYELGREAVSRQLSMLDLAVVQPGGPALGLGRRLRLGGGAAGGTRGR